MTLTEQIDALVAKAREELCASRSRRESGMILDVLARDVAAATMNCAMELVKNTEAAR